MHTFVISIWFNLFDHKVNKYPFSKFSIEKILKKKLNGHHVLLYYEANQVLDSKYRKVLSNCICEHLFETDSTPSRKDFDNIADMIVKLMPNECEVRLRKEFF